MSISPKADVKVIFKDKDMPKRLEIREVNLAVNVVSPKCVMVSHPTEKRRNYATDLLETYPGGTSLGSMFTRSTARMTSHQCCSFNCG